MHKYVFHRNAYLLLTPFMRQVTKLLQLNYCHDIKLWKIFKKNNQESYKSIKYDS